MSDPQSLIMTPGVEFSASSYVYQPLPNDAIIDPHSAAWVGDLLEANAAVAPNVNIEQYSPPVFIVGANQPTVQILANSSYAPLGAQLSAVPLPSDFKPAAGTDHEAVIFQPSTGKYWEVWEAALTGATTTDSAGNVVPQWEADWGGYISNLATNSGSFSGGFGTAASGLPLLAGLMTIAEQQAGVINHSIHISIPEALAKVFVGAATRTDGTSTDPNAIPEGATFRLPADLNLDSMVMNPYARMIAEAVQKYGMVVSDTNGSGVDFYAQNPDGLYATDPYYGPNGILHTASPDPNNPTNWGAASALLASFPWSDLQAVETNSSGLALQAQAAVVVAGAASPAVQGGAAVTLLSGPPTVTDSATTLSSATVKIANAGGSAVTGDELYINGQQSGTLDGGLVTVNWNDSTKVLTLTGNASIAAYQTLLSEVAYQDAGTDSSTGSHPQRTVTWTANDGTANISTTSQIAIERAPVATVANVVLNADFTTIAGSSLVKASDPDGDTITEYGFMANGNGHFVLNGLAQGNNQEIDVTAAQISQLIYQSTVGTDSLQVRVNDGTLWSPWQSFTMSAPPATIIQTDGLTSLTKVGNQYFLDSGDGSGAALKYAGANVLAGQRGGWTPIGAEQTSSGYEVAWKLAGADQYTVWNTDSHGNYVSRPFGHVSGTSIALEAVETSFHQDLNGDRVTGVVTTVIQTDGLTSLTQVGNQYFLDSGDGSGVALKLAGANVLAGQRGGWTPIGAEQTSSGYEVAWKLAGADQYTVWDTNSNGNYVSQPFGHVSGTSIALEAVETSFHQDLNGDRVIGVVTTVIQTDGLTSLTQVGNQYFLDSGDGSGVALKLAGANVLAGQRGGWTPIGAEQTSSGYEVAWKLAGADQYTVWHTGSNGNYVSQPFGHVSGTSTALEAVETSFHQDLNGDGVVGFAVAANATLELKGVHSDNVTFDGSTGMLKLDSPSTFAGHIIGFTGDGTLSGSDQVDLLNMRFSSSIQTASSYDPSTGALTVSNGATVDVLHFIGSYSQDNFEFASDAHGGTIVYDPPTTSQLIPADASDDATVHITANSTINGAGPPDGRQVIVDSGATLTLDHVTAAGGTITNNGTVKIIDNSTVNIAAGAGHDNFVFAPNFGQATISHFTPGTDSVLIDHAIFSSLDALFAAMHNSHGNAVITDAAHDTITVENVTTAQLLAHHSDFHLV